MNESRLPRLRRIAFVATAAVALAALTGCPGGLNVVGTTPRDGATNVAQDVDLSITFSEPVDAETLGVSRFVVTAGSTNVTGTLSTSGATATFSPDARLPRNATITARVLEGVRAEGGAELGAAHQWSFTTNNQAEPFSVVSTTPANGAGGVAPSTITLTLSAEVNPATVSASTVLFDGDPAAVPFTVSVSGTTITVTPTGPLENGRMYRIRLIGVQSTGGETLPPYTFTFATPTGAATGIAGRVTYDWVPAASTAEGGEKLDYARIQARPARRIKVEATVAGGSTLVTSTDDHGFYEFPSIGAGQSVTVRALAELDATGYTPDQRGPEACDGANWDVDVVDNTAGQAIWAVADSTPRTAPAPDVNLHAATTYSNNAYGQRAGAPFAMADTFVTLMEKICQGNPAFTIPSLKANWSPNNVAGGSNPASGQIGTSHYQHPASGPNLYILGDENSDTDEYDDHVVAHEFGHFLEDTLYRSDSVGGQHGPGDILDPRVAFGEGYGNALSAITFDDPVYVDTNGQRQAGGFQIDMSDAPGGNDRGVYSETAVQHFLWMLYEHRDAAPNSGSFDRIHTILRNFQRDSPALTTVQTFAAYYHQQYGAAAEQLQTLWEGPMGSELDSLCEGTCQSGDPADPFDLDNDLGVAYASRTYAGATRAPDFWRLYKTISGAGFAAPGDAHDVTLDTRVHNRFGAQRYYRYVGTGAGRTVRVNQTTTANCSRDMLDIDLFETGFLSSNIDSSGCPTHPVPGASGVTYVIVVNGFPNGATPQDVTAGFGVQLE